MNERMGMRWRSVLGSSLVFAMAGGLWPSVAQAAGDTCHRWDDAVRLSGQLVMPSGAPRRHGAGRPVMPSASTAQPELKLVHPLCVDTGAEHHQVRRVLLVDDDHALTGERLSRCLHHCRLTGRLAEGDDGSSRHPVQLVLDDDPEAAIGRQRRRR